MRILIAEDHPHLGPLIKQRLEDCNFAVDLVTTASALADAVSSSAPGLLIVDLGLPDDDGLKVVKRLRAAGFSMPILIVTARGDVDDRVFGLESGADDYIVKPFEMTELIARVRALLRRPVAFATQLKSVGDLSLDLTSNHILHNGQPVDLSTSEARLLGLFIRRGKRLVVTADIEQISLDLGRETSANGVHQSISRLRRRLTEIGSTMTLRMVRGSGYLLIGVDERDEDDV